MSRLLRGRSRSCCSSRPRAIAWLSIVMLVPPAVTVTTSSRLPIARLRSDAHDGGGAQHHTGSLRLPETGERRRHGVRARTQVRNLEEPLRVGLRFARDAGRFVGDDDSGAGHDLLLRIEDRSANGAESGLCGGGNGRSDQQNQTDSVDGEQHECWTSFLLQLT